MASKSTTTQSEQSPADKPAADEVHQRAREAVEALRAVRDELQRKAAALDEQQVEIRAQLLESKETQARIAEAQAALEDQRGRFEAEHESSKAMVAQHEQELAEKDEQLSASKAELASLEAQLQQQQSVSANQELVDEPELVEAPRGVVEVIPTTPSASPQSAGRADSANSRKLRRNTKRKAIGI